jgi:DNA polymerase
MKLDQYQQLATERKSCRKCMPQTSDLGQGDSKFLTNPAEIAKLDCDLDSNEIGPWAQWQGNLDADIMVVGQDWGDTRYFKDNKGREKANNPTNKALMELMASIGLRIGNPEDVNQPKIAFFTNAILCLKNGGMQAEISDAWFHNCRDFLRRQIEIVNPKIVVGLGTLAYRGVLSAFDLNMKPDFPSAVSNNEGVLLPNGSRVFAVYHCGSRSTNMNRDYDHQLADWKPMEHVLRANNLE